MINLYRSQLSEPLNQVHQFRSNQSGRQTSGLGIKQKADSFSAVSSPSVLFGAVSGKNKTIAIPTLLKSSEGALDKLGGYLQKANIKNIVIVTGQGTIGRLNASLSKDLLEQLREQGINIKQVISVNNKYTTRMDDALTQLNEEQELETGKVDAVIAIGGGTPIDNARYLSGKINQAFPDHYVPYIVVPTSLATDVITSTKSAMVKESDGSKITFDGEMPYGVIMDTTLLSETSDEFLLAGVGDLVSKITACWDWEEGARPEQTLFPEKNPVVDAALYLGNLAVNSLLSFANPNIRDSKFVAQLANSLVMAGLSMDAAGISRVASGGEHLIYYAYERNVRTHNEANSADQKPMPLHGILVGVATYVCSLLQNNRSEEVADILTKTGFIDYLKEHKLDKQAFIQAIQDSQTIKKNFFSVLAMPGKIDQAIQLLDTDPILKEILA